MRQWLYEVLDVEVDELLGCRKSKRWQAMDRAQGYRDRVRPALTADAVTGRARSDGPASERLQPRFVNRLLPLFAGRTSEVCALLSELYLHILMRTPCSTLPTKPPGHEAPMIREPLWR